MQVRGGVAEFDLLALTGDLITAGAEGEGNDTDTDPEEEVSWEGLDHATGEEIYLSYVAAKARWRSFSQRQPRRMRFGKGKGKG